MSDLDLLQQTNAALHAANAANAANAAAAAALTTCLEQLCKAQPSLFFPSLNRFPRFCADVAVVATPTATAQQSPLAAGGTEKGPLSDQAVLSGSSALWMDPSQSHPIIMDAIKALSDRISALESARAGSTPPPPPKAA